jgi:predicted acylesterase/phospholipase RssA
MKENPIKRLIISAGGYKGFIMLGLLQKLLTKELDVADIDVFAGSSAGAIIGTLLALGLEPMTIFLHFCKFLPYKFYDKDTAKLTEALAGICGDVTFKDVKKKLIITAYDKSTDRSIYYTTETHPDMLIYKALAETARIPIFVQPTEQMLDGSLCTPIPVKFCKNLHRGRACIIYCGGDNELSKVNIPFYEDFKRIIGKLYSNCVEHELAYAGQDDLHIKIEAPDLSILYELQPTNALELYIHGMNIWKS